MKHRQTPLKPAKKPSPNTAAPIAEARSAKIEANPEVLAFILARIETLTFGQIPAAIKASFPPDRHVGRSTVHRWWRLYEARGAKVG